MCTSKVDSEEGFGESSVPLDLSQFMIQYDNSILVVQTWMGQLRRPTKRKKKSKEWLRKWSKLTKIGMRSYPLHLMPIQPQFRLPRILPQSPLSIGWKLCCPSKLKSFPSEFWWKPNLERLNGSRTDTTSSISSRKNALAIVKCIKDVWFESITKKDAPTMILGEPLIGKDHMP